MLDVALAFDAGGAGQGQADAPAATDLARTLRVQPEDVAGVVDHLRAAGLVQELPGGGLVPARSIERITLLDVRLAVRGREPSRPEAEPVSVDRALAEVEAETRTRLAGASFKVLCDEERGRLGREAAGPAATSGA